MATIQIISRVYKHPNADCLDIACVLGFECIVPINEFKVDQKILYIATDQILPDAEWAKKYKKRAPKRIRTIKIRERFSEGIVVPLTELPKSGASENAKESNDDSQQLDWLERKEGEDVSKELNIIHYEVVGNILECKSNSLPFFIPKTDEVRFERIYDQLPFGELVDVQEKIDGQSCSYYQHVGLDQFGILGRNTELKEDTNNAYTYHVRNLDIKRKLHEYCTKHQVCLCIRGESYGLSIQKKSINPYCKLPLNWGMYGVFNITSGKDENLNDKHYFHNVAKECGLPIAPLLEEKVVLTKELIRKYSVVLEKLPNGKSFEGVVIKHANGSFKVINKYYDSQH